MYVTYSIFNDDIKHVEEVSFTKSSLLAELIPFVVTATMATGPPHPPNNDNNKLIILIPI